MAKRALALIALPFVAACSVIPAALFEPSAPQLIQTAAANMRNAKSLHLEGTGSIAVKDGMSITLDYTLTGDAELPATSRIAMGMKLFGQSLDVEAIAVNGHSYAKEPFTGRWTEGARSGLPTDQLGVDPLSNIDTSAVTDVVEVDRPVVDGKKTRHLTYKVDKAKVLDKLRQTPGASGADAVTDVDGSGEVWIRIEDSMIVRQLVKMSMRTSLPNVTMPPSVGGAPPVTPQGGTVEMVMDLRLSKFGEPIAPAITAPPPASPTPRFTFPAFTLPPRLATPAPTR